MVVMVGVIEWPELFEVKSMSGSGEFCWWRGWVDPHLWRQSSRLRSFDSAIKRASQEKVRYWDSVLISLHWQCHRPFIYTEWNQTFQCFCKSVLLLYLKIAENNVQLSYINLSLKKPCQLGNTYRLNLTNRTAQLDLRSNIMIHQAIIWQIYWHSY